MRDLTARAGKVEHLFGAQSLLVELDRGRAVVDDEIGGGRVISVRYWLYFAWHDTLPKNVVDVQLNDVPGVGNRQREADFFESVVWR